MNPSLLNTFRGCAIDDILLRNDDAWRKCLNCRNGIFDIGCLMGTESFCAKMTVKLARLIGS